MKHRGFVPGSFFYADISTPKTIGLIANERTF